MKRNPKRAHVYLHLASNTAGTPTSFILVHSNHLMSQIFPRTARLCCLHSDKTTQLDKKTRMIMTLLKSDILPNTTCCNATLSLTQNQHPPLKKRPPFSHLLPQQIKVTYTLLSVSDIVSASLDMLCCSLSLALVAGARAYPVLT